MKIRATTILTVRHKETVAMGGDGQVTLGDSVMKADGVKIRWLADGSVLCGFAGSAIFQEAAIHTGTSQKNCRWCER